MAYQVYITDALVCGSKHHNTADKNYLLFTRELGMLWATARSVREERSKQRFALQDFSIIRVSLVKGKSGWRIGSTESIMNPFLAAASRQARGGVTYLVKVLRRYVHGEQAMATVFDDVAAACALVAASDDVFYITTVQNVAVARLLYALGYVASSKTLREVLAATDIAGALDMYQPQHQKEITALEQAAADVSHL